MKKNEQEQKQENKATGGQPNAAKKNDQAKGQTGQTSEGHAGEGGNGTATSTNEPTLRSATTDSSRAPKNSTDDGPTGGNVR